MSIDFKQLADSLLARASSLLPIWLPGGSFQGSEYSCADINGGKGGSLKYNIHKGTGRDFATGDGFGDMISLYAHIRGLSMKDAAEALMADQGIYTHEPTNPVTVAQPIYNDFGKPERAPTEEDFNHYKWGQPTKDWCYRDENNEPLYYILRYDTKDGKQFAPLSWSLSERKYVRKAWPDNRPLYRANDLVLNHEKPILIVEGEKAADAAAKIAGHIYGVVTWQGGANAVKKTDWSLLAGRKVLIWPDRDYQRATNKRVAEKYNIEIDEIIPYEFQPGTQAAVNIAEILFPICPEIKIIDVRVVQTEGFDAADALDLGWGWAEFSSWARANVKITKDHNTVVPEPVAIEPEVVVDHAPMPSESDQPPGTTYNVLAVGDEALEYLVPQDVPRSLTVLYDECGILRGSNGAPHNNANNVVKILAWSPKFKNHLWYDEFHRVIFFKETPDAEPRAWTETDDLELMHYIQNEFQFHKISRNVVSESVQLFASWKKRNEPKDWMNSLVWDQAPRIDEFFIRAMHVAPSDYIRAVSKNFWISMVARIFKPGCKADEMIIIEGLQGCLKSTALEAIGGKFYAKVREDLASKDFAQALAGKMLMEMDELDRFGKAAETTIKMILSAGSDRYRPSYGRITQDFARTNIFAGSTNEDDYLKDSTGGRRFWPFRVPDGMKCDIDYIREHRDQLFAEAVERFKSGEDWYKVPEKEAKEIQESRRAVDEWTDSISDYLDGKTYPPTPRKTEARGIDIYTGAVGGSVDRFDSKVQKRISRIMKYLEWEHQHTRRNNVSVRVWVRKSSGAEINDAPFSAASRSTALSHLKNYAPGSNEAPNDN